jgi:ubiquinone biosynthesis monooxygenase Coq7
MKGAASAAPFFISMAPRFIDQLLIAADEGLKTLAGVAAAARPMPGTGAAHGSDARLSAGLMRVNHSGEVCAQALYSGQALFARDERVRQALRAAAAEERDHLAWCRDRIRQLDGRTSVLDPLWYAGSFALGVVSGAAGDRWSMGFLEETEAQVERHLDGHLSRLPPDDERSRAVVEQMREDERRHGAMGRQLGAAQLPLPVRAAMRVASRVMTRAAYWV